jgi:hypothetical protein
MKRRLRKPRPRKPTRYRGVCECGEHAWCVLTKGFVTFVSPEDAHLLRLRWSAKQKRRGHAIYARNTRGNQETTLHGFILGTAGGDHRDHDGLNNRRGNLRPATQRQNNANRRHRVGGSGFRGVKRATESQNWEAHLAGRYLGTFATPEAAARAYDAAAIERYGEFATNNFRTD